MIGLPGTTHVMVAAVNKMVHNIDTVKTISKPFVSHLASPLRKIHWLSGGITDRSRRYSCSSSWFSPLWCKCFWCCILVYTSSADLVTNLTRKPEIIKSLLDFAMQAKKLEWTRSRLNWRKETSPAIGLTWANIQGRAEWNQGKASSSPVKEMLSLLGWSKLEYIEVFMGYNTLVVIVSWMAISKICVFRAEQQ